MMALRLPCLDWARGMSESLSTELGASSSDALPPSPLLASAHTAVPISAATVLLHEGAPTDVDGSAQWRSPVALSLGTS